jgi:hypothetical protein
LRIPANCCFQDVNLAGAAMMVGTRFASAAANRAAVELAPYGAE